MVIVKPTTQKSYTYLVEWTEGLKRRRAFFATAKQAASFAARKKEDIKSVAPDECMRHVQRLCSGQCVSVIDEDL